VQAGMWIQIRGVGDGGAQARATGEGPAVFSRGPFGIVSGLHRSVHKSSGSAASPAISRMRLPRSGANSSHRTRLFAHTGSLPPTRAPADNVRPSRLGRIPRWSGRARAGPGLADVSGRGIRPARVPRPVPSATSVSQSTQATPRPGHQPDRWNIDPVLAGSMCHRSGSRGGAAGRIGAGRAPRRANVPAAALAARPSRR
jgi:hypothetical protein